MKYSRRIQFTNDEIVWLIEITRNILEDEIRDKHNSILTWKQKERLLRKIMKGEE